jgi:hypothetical protein
MLREPPEWPFATWLRVDAPGRCSRLQQRLPTESGRIVVHLEADAVVTGRVVPVPNDERGLRIVACPGNEAGDGKPGPVADVAELQADGSFTLPIASGPHRLWLLRQGGAARPLGGAGELRVGPGQRLDLGELSPE